MKTKRLVRDVRALFLNPQDIGQSLINLVTFLLLLWGLIPESLYYNWLLWAGLAGLWMILVVGRLKRQVFDLLRRPLPWLALLWPAYTVGLWLLGRGMLHRKFLAVGFMMLVVSYYLLTNRKRELAGLAGLGAWLYAFIGLTTLAQYLSHPEIARDLAVGRMSGNIKASALLANFHSVYGAVVIAVALAGLILHHKAYRRWKWICLGAGLMLLVVFSRYDIGMMALLLGLAMTVIGYFGKKMFRRSDGLIKEGLATIGLYLVPAGLLAVFKNRVWWLIDHMDYRTIAIPAKLFDRIWVYLRSVYLYLTFPLLGFGVQPEPDQFLSGKHSDYLDLLGEYGLIGFGLFLVGWVGFWLLVRSHLPDSRRSSFWISLITFQFIFMLNPVLEVSAVTILGLLLPGLILYEAEAGNELAGMNRAENMNE